MKKVVSLTRRAIEQYNMIEDGDKIAVGVSGGKDSLVLLNVLAELSRYYPKKFTVMGLTLDMGYDADYSKVQKMCDDLGGLKTGQRKEWIRWSAQSEDDVFLDRCVSDPE